MDIATLTIISWLVVGVLGGLVCAWIYGGKRLLVFDLIIGVLGAIAGGWGSVVAMGDTSQYLYIISILTALFVAALALWFFNILLTRTRK